MIKIGFLVHRNAYYRYFGSIIDETLKKGYKVACFHDYNHPRTGPKGYLFPLVEDVPEFRFGVPEIIPYKDYTDLIENIKSLSVNIIISLHFYPEYSELYKILKSYGVFWVALQHALDTIIASKYLHIPDRYFFYSKMWLDWAIYYLSNVEKDTAFDKETLEEKVKCVGFPELDQISLIDPKQVRTEWGIPEEKPVVLLLPFPFGSSNDRFWTRFIYGMNNPLVQLPLALLSFRLRYIKQVLYKWNDVNVIQAIKKFCERNNTYLLVKSRLKDPVQKYLKVMADKVLYDEEYYPATILKCLSIADICIHFLSSTVTEAVLLNVPCISVTPKFQDWKDLQHPVWKALVWNTTENIFNFPGVSYMLSIEDSSRLLPNATFENFPLNQIRQKEYVEKFLGYSDGKSSQRVLTEIEELVK